MTDVLEFRELDLALVQLIANSFEDSCELIVDCERLAGESNRQDYIVAVYLVA